MGGATAKYFAPRTIEEACLLLATCKEEARIVAGGTDLIPQLRGKPPPTAIVNIGNIPGQNTITRTEKGGLKIGAQATIRALASSPVVRENFAALAAAAAVFGSPQVRGVASVGGNLCNASPSAETIPALMALGATVRILRAGAERTVRVEDFVTGPGKTVLGPEEIVAELSVPPLPAHSASVYLSQRVRKQLDLAIAGVAAAVTMDGEAIRRVRIALGAVAPTVVRARAAEAMLEGATLSEGLLARAAEAAAAESRPIDDCRGSAQYRRQIVRVLVTRVIKQAAAQVK